MSDRHVAEQATLLVAIGEADPEQREAIAHARSCPACAGALDEARADLALLERLPAALPPEPQVLRAIEAQIVALLPPRGRVALVRATAVIVAGVLLVAIAKKRAPVGVPWGIAAGALGVAIVGVTLARVRASRRVALAVATSVGLAIVAATTNGFAPLIGAKCVAIELLGAALPFAAALHARRRWGIALTSIEGAAVATAGALAGHAALHLTCPVRDAGPHLFAFHVGGVLLAAVLGSFGAGLGRPRLGDPGGVHR